MATKSRYKKYVEGMHAIQENRQSSTKEVKTESVLEKLKKAKIHDTDHAE